MATALQPAESRELIRRSAQTSEEAVPELHWRRSTYSGDGSNCVEMAVAPTTIHIRDSKHPTGPHLTLQPTAWADFLAQLRN